MTKYLEYAIYHLDYNEEEIKQCITKAIRRGVNCISVPFAYTKLCRTMLRSTSIITANSIDYPMGISDIKTRSIAIKNAVDNGAQKISIVLQNNLLNLKKYDKIKQDIETNISICKDLGVHINYYLEYRIFTHQSLIKACHLLKESGIDSVYVSTGQMIDSIEDNIIACVLLKQKTSINTIFTANLWNKHHLDLLNKNDIKEIRISNLAGLDLT